jgi:Ca-activated chloride channel homolog
MRVHHSWLSGQFLVRQAVAICCFVLMSVAGLAQQPKRNNFVADASATKSDDTIKLATQVVSLTVSVTDKTGRPITGLEKGSFQLFEDNVAQEVSYFGYSDQPLSVGVVFDLSGSMGREKLQRAKDALASFAKTCHERDDLALVGFNDRAWLVGDRLLSPDALTNAFGLLSARGQTALYDGVAMGLTHVANGHQPRKALIIISDGEDNRSRATFGTIRRMAQENAATIYAIGIHDFGPQHGYGRFILEELADLTGGKAFFPFSGEEMREAFDEIAVDLRQQYSIGYLPTNFQVDGKLRRIKIKLAAVKTGKANLRYRTGYIANGKGQSDDVRADN